MYYFFCSVKGTEYTNYKGVVVPAKSMGTACNCKLKCFKNISDNQQMEAYTKFYNLSTKDEQDLYLQGLIHFKPVQQRRSLAQSREEYVRNSTFIYYIIVDSQRNKVCKKAFLNFHFLSNKRLQRLQQLLPSGTTPKDKRGKQVSANTILATEKIRIHEHTTPLDHISLPQFRSDSENYVSTKLS
ncbi:hypothetical protein ILUMI_10643 [Ignelater luminosus]|uniref:Uncharacterized protein n=1 Tax=Ignelater luminosus TaxID=2038154 RepID=A0A8K0CXH1_IGNLU|nr:hypothetical protein ILUMI_10643 [Ignelater luminosus]